MTTPHRRARRISGLLALAIAAAALLALPGMAAAKHHHRAHPRGHNHASASQAHLTTVEEASTITSFDATTGKLTIALTGGESVTGLVTEDTEIKCEGNAQSLESGDDQGEDNGWESGQTSEESDSTDEESHSSDGESHSSDEESHSSDEESPSTDEGGSCTTASLTPGSIVGGAELRLERGSAVFKEIELGLGS